MILEKQELTDLLEGLEISPKKIDEISAAIDQKNILNEKSQEIILQEQMLDIEETELRQKFALETEWRKKSQLMARIISLRL